MVSGAVIFPVLLYLQSGSGNGLVDAYTTAPKNHRNPA